MATRHFSRLTAALLAAIFIGSVGGASDLDAILFHRGGATVAAGVSHVEQAANGACHAERCVLALRLASGRAQPRLDLHIRFEGIPQHDAGARPVSAPPAAVIDHQAQPRAPPASVA